MNPTLAWLDHDEKERGRMVRILALFKERETRDELGVGSIRDSFADLLFPGTSTIQTRLRYFFFLPWIFQELERRQVRTIEMEQKSREAETALVAPLLDENESGIFGKTSGEPPSSRDLSLIYINLQQIHGYNSVNLRESYPLIEIRTPGRYCQMSKTEKRFDAVAMMRAARDAR